MSLSRKVSRDRHADRQSHDVLTISCAGCDDPLEFSLKPPTSPRKVDLLRERLIAAMRRLVRSASVDPR